MTREDCLEHARVWDAIKLEMRKYHNRASGFDQLAIDHLIEIAHSSAEQYRKLAEEK